ATSWFHRWRAITSPSPPLLPLPQQTTTGPRTPWASSTSAAPRPAFSISTSDGTPSSSMAQRSKARTSARDSAIASPRGPRLLDDVDVVVGQIANAGEVARGDRGGFDKLAADAQAAGPRLQEGRRRRQIHAPRRHHADLRQRPAHRL